MALVPLPSPRAPWMVEGQSLHFSRSLTPQGQNNCPKLPSQTHLGCPTASLGGSVFFFSSLHPIWKLLNDTGTSLATNRAGLHSKNLTGRMERPGWTRLGATWASGSCPCPWNKTIFKDSPTPNQPGILTLFPTME